MTVLLSREFAPGRFQKVLVLKGTNGRGSLSQKWNGSIESLAARNAARFFYGEPKATTVFAEYGRQKFRADVVDR